MTAQSGLGFSGIVAIQIPDDGATGEVLTKLTPDDYDYDWAAGGAGSAPANATYVVMSLNGILTDERVLTAGTDIGIVDGGAGGAVTISVTGSFGDVFKVGTPVDDQVGVWTGDGTLEGDPDFTWDGDLFRIESDAPAPALNNIGFVMFNSNSVANPDGWQAVYGVPGLFDGNWMFADDPADTIATLRMRLQPNNSVVYALGAAVGVNNSFRSETAGALAYFMPQDTTGREETKISFVGLVGGTGNEGVFSIEGFAYGDSGLQFHRLAHFVIDADYRTHLDVLGVLSVDTETVLAGDLACLGRTAADGLQLIGQGSTNDVTVYNDTLTAVIEIPTGTTEVNFAGTVRIVTGFIQTTTVTDAILNDITDPVNTSADKIQGAQLYNSDQDVPVWAVGAADGDVWVDGAGTTVNTPV